MSAIPGNLPPYNDAVAKAWAPSEQARSWLFMGCVAVLLDAGLSTAGLGASLLEGPAAARFSPSRCLEWLAVLPQFGVLMAFLTLAREAGHRGLWKGSLGFFGATVLLLVLDLATDDSLPKNAHKGAAVALGFGLASLIVVAFLTLPNLGKKEGTGPKGKGCLAGAIVPIIFILVRVLAKLPKLKLNLETWIVVEGGLLVLLGIFYVAWFASAKIRLADKFGSVALWLGAFEFLALISSVLALVAFFAVAAPSLAAQPAANNGEFERLVELWLRGAKMASIGAYVIWSALAAWLFLSVRRLGERDWRFEFSADGVRPWESPRSEI